MSGAGEAERNSVRRNVPGRFDIVVWNFERVELFLDNFGKILNFDPARDRITIVSASPSPAETRHIREFEDNRQVSVRYLTRRNRGRNELARAEYFAGLVGCLDGNLSHAYILGMQDHYLDTTTEASRWGPELDSGAKTDVIPDGASFDLDRMERLVAKYDLKGFFCDRENPCFFTFEGRRYIAPNGGNFAIRSDAVRDGSVQQSCRRLIRSCDDSSNWALYAEFMWGLIFFQEGERFYDLKRERLFESWDEEEFQSFPIDFPRLKKFYERPAPIRTLIRLISRLGFGVNVLIRGFRNPRWAVSAVLRSALSENAYRRFRATYRRLVDVARRVPREPHS